MYRNNFARHFISRFYPRTALDIVDYRRRFRHRHRRHCRHRRRRRRRRRSHSHGRRRSKVIRGARARKY